MIDYLLKKYSSYVPGEYESKEREKQRKRKKVLDDYEQTLRQLLNEAPNLNLNKYEYERVRYFLEIADLKELHRQSKLETIILAIIFYVKISQNIYVRIDTWSICKKYGLTDRIFTVIIIRLVETILKRTPLPIKPTTKYNHNLLEKEAF